MSSNFKKRLTNIKKCNKYGYSKKSINFLNNFIFKQSVNLFPDLLNEVILNIWRLEFFFVQLDIPEVVFVAPGLDFIVEVALSVHLAETFQDVREFSVVVVLDIFNLEVLSGQLFLEVADRVLVLYVHLIEAPVLY